MMKAIEWYTLYVDPHSHDDHFESIQNRLKSFDNIRYDMYVINNLTRSTSTTAEKKNHIYTILDSNTLLSKVWYVYPRIWHNKNLNGTMTSTLSYWKSWMCISACNSCNEQLNLPMRIISTRFSITWTK